MCVGSLGHSKHVVDTKSDDMKCAQDSHIDYKQSRRGLGGYESEIYIAYYLSNRPANICGVLDAPFKSAS